MGGFRIINRSDSMSTMFLLCIDVLNKINIRDTEVIKPTVPLNQKD